MYVHTYVPVAALLEELSTSAITLTLNDREVDLVITSVTTSEPADFGTVRLEEWNSTNVSVKILNTLYNVMYNLCILWCYYVVMFKNEDKNH